MTVFYDELKFAFEQSSLEEFGNALRNGCRADRRDSNGISIYERCLQRPHSEEFINLCLKYGCQKNYFNADMQKAAINYAADSFCSSNILAILNDTEGIQVDHQYATLTPLNAIAKQITKENVRHLKVAINRLLEYGASPNIPDRKGFTPLHYIVMKHDIDKAEKRQLVMMFLQKEYLDIDRFRNCQLRELLMEEYPDLKLPDPRSKIESVEITYEKLINELKYGEQHKFITLLSDYRGSENVFLNLLEECIKSGRNEVFKHILKTQKNLDINKGFAGEIKLTLAELAAIYGNFDALKELLNHEKLQLNPDRGMLINAVGKLDEPLVYPNCNYVTCFQQLADSKHVDINEMDKIGETALHYAARYHHESAILHLLTKGALLGKKNNFGEMPLADMECILLENHFDQCISVSGKRSDAHFEITMDFKNFRDGFSGIEYMAQSKRLRPLLQHPLISSFILLKWSEICGNYYFHMLMHAIFIVLFATQAYYRFPKENSDTKWLRTTIFCLIWPYLGYLIVAEIIKIFLRKWQYISFRSALNVMMIILSFLSTTIVFKDREVSRLLTVYSILLMVIKFSSLLGTLPYQRSISTHVLMLHETFINFFKCLLPFLIYFIGFAFTFYIIFAKEKIENQQSYHSFSTPFLSLIKTMIISTGEYEMSTIQFESILSYLFFLLFVITTTIVILNLLTGIAVGDTQTIRAQAEINGSICRIKILQQYEIFQQMNAITKISIYPNQKNKVVVHPEIEEVKIVKSDTFEMTPLVSREEKSNKRKNFVERILHTVKQKNRNCFNWKISKKTIQKAIAIGGKK